MFTFIYLIISVCAGSCLLRRLSVAVAAGITLLGIHKLPAAGASPTVEHRLSGVQALVVAAHRLGRCGCRPLAYRVSSSGARA